MNTRRPVGVILHRKPGTTVSRSSTSLVWGWAASTAVLVSLIFAMMTPWNDPDSKSQIGAARGKTGSSFRKHRHMMDARKLLINLLYRATAKSSELPGWSHRETKKQIRRVPPATPHSQDRKAPPSTGPDAPGREIGRAHV